MAWHKRWLSASVVGLSGWLVAGCTSSLPEWAQPRQSMATFISEPGAPQLRAQMGDAPRGVQINAPRPLDLPSPFEKTVSRTEPAPTIEQTSFSKRGTVSVRVRAWVNGQPIFDNEVMQMAEPRFYTLPKGLSNAQMSEKMAEIVNSTIEELIDQELMYQDAVKKLEKANPSALDKLREFVDLEFDKNLQRMREAKWPEDRIREVEPAARRMLARSLISSEYARSRLRPLVDTRVGLMEIREYYETHLNEFLSEDKITWQDIFIPINPNQPTIEDVKRFAEDLINKCRTDDDFNKLIAYDALGKNGEGHGNRPGEIKPAELAPYLFKLEAGKIGPVVPLGSGVHLIRVTKREYKGQLPLNDEVAKTIRRKLEKELADREYRRLVRDLRARAVWRVEKDTQ